MEWKKRKKIFHGVENRPGRSGFDKSDAGVFTVAAFGGAQDGVTAQEVAAFGGGVRIVVAEQQSADAAGVVLFP